MDYKYNHVDFKTTIAHISGVSHSYVYQFTYTGHAHLENIQTF